MYGLAALEKRDAGVYASEFSSPFGEIVLVPDGLQIIMNVCCKFDYTLCFINTSNR